MAATTSASLSSLLPISHHPKLASPSVALCPSNSPFPFPPKTSSISLSSSLLHSNSKRPPIVHVSAELNKCHEPLKVMISGAPASGKGTQCELIVKHVPDNVLVERVVGRRLDPVTGRIYHLKYSPPESKEIAERLTQRFDDTQYQAKLRLQTHSQNVEAVVNTYKSVIKKVDGNRPKEEVFQDIDRILMELQENFTRSVRMASQS